MLLRTEVNHDQLEETSSILQTFVTFLAHLMSDTFQSGHCLGQTIHQIGIPFLFLSQELSKFMVDKCDRIVIEFDLRYKHNSALQKQSL